MSLQGKVRSDRMQPGRGTSTRRLTSRVEATPASASNGVKYSCSGVTRSSGPVIVYLLVVMLGDQTCAAHRCKAFSRRALLQTTAAVAAGALPPAASNAIVGGIGVSQAEMDARGLVGLVDEAGPTANGVCTGTRIGDNLILTARHCIEPQQDHAPLQQISFSTDAFSADAVVRPIIDGRFAADPDADLAILRFSGSTPAAHRPVRLLSARDPLFALEERRGEERSVTVYGFGKDGQGAARNIGRLRKLQGNINGPFDEDGPSILGGWPSSQDEGQCFGDSGGPAFLTLRAGGTAQVGVLSGISAGSASGASGATASGASGAAAASCAGGVEWYVNLAKYDGWIRKAVASLGGELP